MNMVKNSHDQINQLKELERDDKAKLEGKLRSLQEKYAEL